MINIALYARVSSERQAQSNTIASQISEIENKIKKDGFVVLENLKFIDNGFSGSNLIRPALEQLRDKVVKGDIDKIYIHSPDRLSRKYAYQMILLEEFKKFNVEVIFLNHEINDNPESHLLLQVQGIIAEYERAKIMERNRRGKLHAAKNGSINILAGAPYGYRYIDKHSGSGQAVYEIHAEESEVIRKIFIWVGQERLTISEVRRRLKKMNIPSAKGKPYWNRSVICYMLKNPAYKGKAAFGKTKLGAMLPRVRPSKNSSEYPKYNYSIYKAEKENWIYIPVPAITSEALFDLAQEQLEENRRIARIRKTGTTYLLQGLLVCACCNYAYYGMYTTKKKRDGKINRHTYYRCVGADAYRLCEKRNCENKLIRTDTLDIAVWEEVKSLLKNPTRILEEYQRRMTELKNSPNKEAVNSLEKQEEKLKRGIDRLIDSYTQENIEKEEFEPRIKEMKKRLKLIAEQKEKIMKQTNLENDLENIVINLQQFSSEIESNLENIDWHSKRDIIRSLVKRVEINFEDINIVFRIQELPSDTVENTGKSKSLQHCCRGSNSCARRPAA